MSAERGVLHFPQDIRHAPHATPPSAWVFRAAIPQPRAVPAVNRDAFARRVQDLREAWSEHRQVRTLAATHDFDSQYQLLLLLHRWSSDASADINRVYEGVLQTHLDATLSTEHREPGFTFVIAPGYSLALALVQRPRSGEPHWFISVSLNAGPAGPGVPAGPRRRTGQWTRAQLEDLVLSVLGAHERAVSGNGGPSSSL